MRFTRSKYHQTVRNAKKKKLGFVNDSLARSLCDTSKCDFWRRVKAIKTKVQCVPTVIDCISDDTDIAEIFASRYRTLYNCTAYDKYKMATLENILNAKISRGSTLAQFYDVKSQEVYEAIHTLKSEKMDGLLICVVIT